MGFWDWLKQSQKKPAKTAIAVRVKPPCPPLTEDRLLAILQEQNFFPLAKLSYRQNFTWRAGARAEHPPGKQRKNKQRKAEREKTALLHDHPPYTKIAAKIVPVMLYWAERWEQMTDPYTADARPWLRYVADPYCHHGHIEKDRVVYSITHPFWDEWMPPNSLMCQCSVQNLTAFLLERHKGTYNWRVDVPLSSFHYPHPDAGFCFNPGKL